LPDNTECLSLGDVDGSGEIVTREEGLAYCAQALAALSPALQAVTPDTRTEYSRWLVQEHEAWLDQQASKHSGLSRGAPESVGYTGNDGV